MYNNKNNLQNYSCNLKCTCAYLSVVQQVIGISEFIIIYIFLAKSNSATYAWEISFDEWWRKRGIKCKPTGNYHGSINRLTEMYLTSETKRAPGKKNAVMHILPKNSLMHDHYFLKIQVLSHQYSIYCSKCVVNVLKWIRWVTELFVILDPKTPNIIFYNWMFIP